MGTYAAPEINKKAKSWTSQWKWKQPGTQSTGGGQQVDPGEKLGSLNLYF